MSEDAVLFRSADLLVRRGPVFGGEVCFVTFAPYTHERTLDRPGFGEAFLASRHLDGVHVISRTNAWFDYPEIDAALEAVAEGVAGYKRVIAYGSSMGGYAAVRFADRVGASAAIALSPQYAVDRRAAPFERRFAAERPAGGWRLAPEHGSTKAVPYLLFDPLDLDRRHADAIARAYPLTKLIPLRHAGHPAAAYLAETGLLAQAVLDIARDSFDPAAFAAEARRRRAQSPQYLFTLARRLGPRHEAAKIALARAAICARDDAVYRLYLATLLERSGDVAGAEDQRARAQAMLPGHPLVLHAQAAFAMRQGRPAQARDPLIAAVAQAPQDHRFTQVLAVANALCGLPPPRPPAAMAPGRAARVAWAAWLRVVGLLARAHCHMPRLAGALPRWHERYFSLARELDLIDEWRSRRRQRRPGPGQGLLSFLGHKSR